MMLEDVLITTLLVCGVVAAIALTLAIVALCAVPVVLVASFLL